MQRLISVYLFLVFLPPFSAAAQPANECPEESLGVKTVTGKLNGTYIEENSYDIPSSISLIVKGKEIDIVGEPEELTKYFKNKIGKKFTITYETIHGWLGQEA